MLVQLDRVIDRGILTVAPTAASRGWNAVWLRRWLRDRGRPPARASWTLVPEFARGAGDGAAGRRNGAGDGLVPHRRGRDGGARHGGGVGSPTPAMFSPCKPRPCRAFGSFTPPISRCAPTSSGPGGRVATRYGFEEYDGPPLEPLELYTAKSGDEIVGQLYTFTDKGGREVALRPEMTPTLARMVAARANGLKKPIRWFSIPQLFRYERQQRGRLREHFQLNCDLIGEPGPLGDAEIIALAIDVMRAFGLGPADVRVRLSDRRVLRALLLGAGRRPSRSSASAYQVVDKIERLDRAALTAAARRGRRRRRRGGAACSRSPSCAGCRRSSGARPACPAAPRRAALSAGSWTRSRRWGSASSSMSTSRSCAGWRTTPAPCSSCSTPAGRCAPSAAAAATTACSQALGGVDLPALGFGMGDVVLGELLRERGLVPDRRVEHRRVPGRGHRGGPAVRAGAWRTSCATRGSGSSTRSARRRWASSSSWPTRGARGSRWSSARTTGRGAR